MTVHENADAPAAAWKPTKLWLVLLIVVANGIFLLITLDRWTYNNDPLHALDIGYNIGGGDADIRKFYDASVENCRRNAAPEAVDSCIGYQSNIVANLFPNYPMYNFFGYLLQFRYEAGPFLEQVGHTIAAMAFAALLVASLLAIIPLWQVSQRELLGMTLILVLGGLAQRAGGKVAFSLAGPATGDTTIGAVLVVTSAALAAVLLTHLQAARGWSPRSLQMPEGWRTNWLLLGLPALLLAGRSLGYGREVFQAAAAIAFVGLFLTFAVRARLPILPATAIGVVLVGAVNDLYGLVLETPRMQVFFVVAAVLAYVTLRPRGRLVWLLPFSCLFHFASAGIAAFVIAVAESILCLRRKRFSHLLGASIVTMAPAVIFGLVKTADPLIGVSGHAVTALLEGLASSPELAVGPAIVALFLFGLAIGLLLHRDDGWDGVARFALLLIAVVIALLVARVLGEENLYTPGYYSLVGLKTYFVPAIDLGIVLGLIGLLGNYADVAERGGRLPIGGGGPGRLWVTLVAAALCLIVAAAPSISVTSNLSALLRGPAMLSMGKMPLGWPNLAIAARDDDDYYLNAAKPKNDPIVYFSLLKMKIRKSLGRFDASRMRIYVIDGGSVNLVAGGP